MSHDMAQYVQQSWKTQIFLLWIAKLIHSWVKPLYLTLNFGISECPKVFQNPFYELPCPWTIYGKLEALDSGIYGKDINTESLIVNKNIRLKKKKINIPLGKVRTCTRSRPQLVRSYGTTTEWVDKLLLLLFWLDSHYSTQFCRDCPGSI